MGSRNKHGLDSNSLSPATLIVLSLAMVVMTLVILRQVASANQDVYQCSLMNGAVAGWTYNNNKGVRYGSTAEGSCGAAFETLVDDPAGWPYYEIGQFGCPANLAPLGAGGCAETVPISYHPVTDSWNGWYTCCYRTGDESYFYDVRLKASMLVYREQCSDSQVIDPVNGCACPADRVEVNGECMCPKGTVEKAGQCIVPPPCSDSAVGNPCDAATGNKSQMETDYGGTVGIDLTRAYNSAQARDFGFGVGWTAGFNRRLLIDDDNLLIQRGAGWQDPFTRQDGVWNGDTTTDFILVENANVEDFTNDDFSFA